MSLSKLLLDAACDPIKEGYTNWGWQRSRCLQGSSIAQNVLLTVLFLSEGYVTYWLRSAARKHSDKLKKREDAREHLFFNQNGLL